MGKTIEERAKINAVKAIEYACGRREGEPNYVTNLFIKMATEQKDIDIDIIPRLYMRWFMIDGEKPTWKEYANKAMEE